MLGPTLIHKHKDEDAFGYQANCLVRLRPKLANILGIGSDRDKAIQNGFSKHLHRAVFIACKKNTEDEIKSKLTELGITATILKDIFGSDVIEELGLLNKQSGREFDQALQDLKPVWDELEKKARDTTFPKFNSWFLRYQAKDAKEMMLHPISRDHCCY